MKLMRGTVFGPATEFLFSLQILRSDDFFASLCCESLLFAH